MLDSIIDVNFLKLRKNKRPQSKRSQRIPQSRGKATLTSGYITVQFKNVKEKALKYCRKRNREHM